MELKSTLVANMKLGNQFMETMEKAFVNLRADHDVATVKLSKKKIEALKQVHVDVTGKVTSL